jgi:hypothetical protein
MGWNDEDEAVEARDGVCNMTDMFSSELSRIRPVGSGYKLDHGRLYDAKHRQLVVRAGSDRASRVAEEIDD